MGIKTTLHISCSWVFLCTLETAYLTAVIALIVTIIEILASIYLPKEHVHFKGVINEVHENCEKDENKWDEEHALDMVLNDIVKDIDEDELDIPNKRILTHRKRDADEWDVWNGDYEE